MRKATRFLLFFVAALSLAQLSFADDSARLLRVDHYVRVHTAAGSRLIHMPLNQAIGVLGAVDGLRTHRSWWVARHAVARIEGTPRSMTLRLSNGIVAPVARSSVAIIRSAGWLEPRP